MCRAAEQLDELDYEGSSLKVSTTAREVFTIQYNTIQYNTIQYNTIQYNTVLYYTILYYIII